MPGGSKMKEKLHFMGPGAPVEELEAHWLDNCSYECSEPVLITESGCEKFVEFPQQLFVKY